MSQHSHEVGDTRTFEGIEYTWNGEHWTYKVHRWPHNIVEIFTYAGEIPEVDVTPANITNTYDWLVLPGLSTGYMYANEVQVSS